MNLKKSYCIIFAFIYFFYFAFAAEKVSINGIVNDSNGKPVKKAEIELLTSKKKSVTKIKTDKNGNFILENIDAQNYYLEISKKKESNIFVREAVLQVEHPLLKRVIFIYLICIQAFSQKGK